MTPGVKFRNTSLGPEFKACWEMKPKTKSGCARAADTQDEVYSGVIRLPSLLISAMSSSPRACGGGPSSCKACSRSVGFESPDDRERLHGIGGVLSNVWEMVVVAVTTLFFRGRFASGSELSLSSSPPPAASSSEELPSREGRGVPVVISVKTDWFREVRVAIAAE